MADYSSDGPDGTTFAFRKGPVACLVRGEWNGGADDQPSIPADDWYNVTAICTSPVPVIRREPNPMEDSPGFERYASAAPSSALIPARIDHQQTARLPTTTAK